MIHQALRLFSLLLVALTIQWGGAAHAVSHLGDDAEHAAQVCELCVAYSAFEHGLANTAAKPTTPNNSHSTPASPVFRLGQLSAGHDYYSRAPPLPAF